MASLRLEARLRHWVGALALGAAASPTFAQIVLDGTMGAPGALSGPNFAIGANLGQQRGGNLFHSFSQFNVLTGQSATFSGPGSVANIISRVTGGSASSIDGLLRSTIGGANLFLINPKGVMFGPNASLDVGGSFHVSTADYLKLGTTGRFDATNPGASVLSTAPPSAFGFLGSAPAPVTVNGSALSVSAGNTLSVIGGDVTLSGATLTAPAGRINLASMGSLGEVTLGAAAIGATSASLGNITAANSYVSADSAAGLPSGSVYIRGGKLTMLNSVVVSGNDEVGVGGNVDVHLSGELAMDDSLVRSVATGLGDAGNVGLRVDRLSLTNGAQVSASAFGPGRSGNVTIAASESVLVSGGNGFGLPSGIFSSGNEGGSGTISITAPVVTLDDNSLVSSSTFGSGDAGNLNLSVGRLEMHRGAQMTSSTASSGHGGTITISATESVSLSSDASIFTAAEVTGSGNTGSISVTTPLFTADDATMSTISLLTGNAGDINLQVGSLRLRNGAYLNSSTFGSGLGGSLIVNASESVELTGNSSRAISGLYSTTGDDGDGGSIQVTAPRLLLDGGAIATGSIRNGNGGPAIVRVGEAEFINGGRVDATSFIIGNGGNIDLSVSGRLSISGKRDTATTEGVLREFVRILSNDQVNDFIYAVVRPAFGDFATSGVFSRSAFAGNGGAINISAGQVAIADGGTINAGSSNAGSAGSIALNAGSTLKLTGGASISTQALLSDGGNITITARDLVYLEDSSITTSVGTGLGNGGNINIDPVFVVLNNGQIIANAFGGNGGNINIVSQFFLVDPGSLVQASSAFGLQGSVTVSAPSVDLGAGLVALPSNFFDASSLMRESCAARAGHASNSFTGAPRGGLPAGPEHFGFATYSDAAGGTLARSARGETAIPIHMACLL